MTGHSHVILDEAVFHGYQDVADAARRLIEKGSGGDGLSYGVARIDEALAESHAANDLDQRHHQGPAVYVAQSNAVGTWDDLASYDSCEEARTRCDALDPTGRYPTRVVPRRATTELVVAP